MEPIYFHREPHKTTTLMNNIYNKSGWYKYHHTSDDDNNNNIISHVFNDVSSYRWNCWHIYFCLTKHTHEKRMWINQANKQNITNKWPVLWTKHDISRTYMKNSDINSSSCRKNTQIVYKMRMRDKRCSYICYAFI